MMLSYLTDAIAACEQALDDPPQFAAACQQLGHLLQGMARFEEAICWHTWATEPPADRLPVYTSLGNLYAEQRRWQQAIAAYQHALSLNPDHAEAYWGLAQILSQSGKATAAVAYWDRAATLNPQKVSAEGYVNLGNALWQHGNPKQAIERYLSAIRLDPQCEAAYNNLAELLIAAGQPQQAIACYRRAIQQADRPAWAHYKLGNLLLKQEQVAEAAAAFQQCVALSPDYPWAHHNWIESLHRLARWDEAIAVTQALIEQTPDQPWAHTYLGRAFAAQRQWQAAVSCHQQASRLRGWHECPDKHYQFTQDWFTHNIPLWQEHLQPLIGAEAQFLEIGSYQGMSACWLLDRILTHPRAALVCIDPNFQVQFPINISLTGAATKVKPLVGSSHDLLPTLSDRAFDAVYIDGCHLASHVQQDANLAWRLLKSGGLMIFDDYEWTDPGYPGQDPKLGIDAFLESFQDQLDILHRAYQVIIRKH